MEFIFGLFTVYFVYGAALLIRDASAGALRQYRDYPLWPYTCWKSWKSGSRSPGKET